MKVLAFIPALLIATVFPAQDVKQGLIVVHADARSGSEFKQKIYNYHFVNGQYTSREELLVVSGKKEGRDYIRTDLGNSTLYKDRYLITGIGNIIDLKEKKILFDGRATLVRCSNDSAIYYTNDISKGKFYSVFNFATGQYGEVKNLVFKAKYGQDVEFDKSSQPFKLFLYPQNKPKVLLTGEAGYGQTAGKDGKSSDPPLLWLDDNNFVFASFNKENTEVSLIKINADTKKVQVIGKAAMKAEPQPAVLQKIDANKVLLILGSKQVLADHMAMSVTELAFSYPENGFSYECKAGPNGRSLKVNEKENGRYHFQPKNFRTSKNIAALVKEIVMGEESYQQGLGVWNNSVQAWKAVDCEDVLTMPGWIQE